jgi:hypothetical protein
MICENCRAAEHDACPEVFRQLDITLARFERLASRKCDCQHKTRPGLIYGKEGT